MYGLSPTYTVIYILLCILITYPTWKIFARFGAWLTRCRLAKYLWTLHYNRVYSFVDEELCCCGADKCQGDETHSFRSAKEYTVTTQVYIKTGEKK
jgi:hypothetical protein